MTAENSHILGVYKRSSLEFDHGRGALLYTTPAEDDPYLDFACGYGVTALGHAHPDVVRTITAQAEKLLHSSNIYQIKGLEAASKALCDASGFADKAWFCNSGLEAVEMALKLTRKYQHGKGHAQRHRMISFDGCFHGRSLSAIFASDKPKMIGGFGPMTVQYDRVAWDDPAALEAAITPETAGIIIEPVQGEGGIRVASPKFLQDLREVCDRHGLVLIFDEIQCGAGRTGNFYAYQESGVTPDIVTTAKGIGNGFPVAATLMTDAIAQYMTPGTHGSTYSANPIAVQVVRTVLGIINDKDFLVNVAAMGAIVMQKLQHLSNELGDVVKDVSGKGLMIGFKVTVDPAEFVRRLEAQHVLALTAGTDSVRLLPPLIVTENQIDQAIDAIGIVARSFTSQN